MMPDALAVCLIVVLLAGVVASVAVIVVEVARAAWRAWSER